MTESLNSATHGAGRSTTSCTSTRRGVRTMRSRRGVPSTSPRKRNRPMPLTVTAFQRPWRYIRKRPVSNERTARRRERKGGKPGFSPRVTRAKNALSGRNSTERYASTETAA